MKYIVVLGDGMADYPIEQLNNKTPLQFANIPTIDYMAKHGEIGMVRTIPQGMPAGSDTANLSVMGYDPQIYYSGRSPFEAASMRLEIKDTDITFRCNIVTLSEDENYVDKVMLDHSADEISSEEAKELIKAINESFGTDEIRFYPGISYRHLMIWSEGPYEWNLIPPHDIIGKKIADYLPKGKSSEVIEEMMRKSIKILSGHEINTKRIEKGLKPGNAIWIWGEGKKPLLSGFSEKYGLKGSVISAVDLVKGIGLCAGLNSIDVEGSTGNIHTNFIGEARAALEALKNGEDFVYVHIEAPDECGHRFEIENKVRAIEFIDNQIVKTLKEGLDEIGEEYKMMILPDHATPLSLRTHTDEPVPFLIYDSRNKNKKETQTYDEFCAKDSGIYIEKGYTLMEYFLK